jgi:DNA-binding SARP family transcriptional activator
MSSLRFRLLGPFQVWRNDELIAPQDWPTYKTRDLLKILVTERGHVVSVDRLIDLLWPDLALASAANSLRVAICRLRRLLEPERARSADSQYIVTVGQGYGFQVTPDSWIDVDVFLSAVSKGQEAERHAAWGSATVFYQAAEELYLGDYLEENPYDDWAMATREQLREIHLDMLSRLAHCHAQQGHNRRALEAGHKVLAVDALRESVYRQVMLYHYQLGQRDQALRAYDRCRSALIEELGVDPLPETQDLYTRILRKEPFDRPALASKVHVERLSTEALAQLVHARAALGWDSSAFARRLYQETEGDPRLLVELLRSLFEADQLVDDDAAC